MSASIADSGPLTGWFTGGTLVLGFAAAVEAAATSRMESQRSGCIALASVPIPPPIGCMLADLSSTRRRPVRRNAMPAVPAVRFAAVRAPPGQVPQEPNDAAQ